MKNKLFFSLIIALSLMSVLYSCSDPFSGTGCDMYILDEEITLDDNEQKVINAKEATLKIIMVGDGKANVSLNYSGVHGYISSFMLKDVSLDKSYNRIDVQEQAVQTDVTLGQDQVTCPYNISGNLKKRGDKWVGLIVLEGTSFEQHHRIEIKETSTSKEDFSPSSCDISDLDGSIEIQYLLNSSDSPIEVSYLDCRYNFLEERERKTYEIAPGEEAMFKCLNGTMRGCDGCLEHGEDVKIKDKYGNIYEFIPNVQKAKEWITHRDYAEERTKMWVRFTAYNVQYVYE